MNEATKQAILSAVRSVLVVVGSLLSGNGVLDDETYQQILGAVMVIIPLVWGVLEKYQAENKTKAREVVAMQAAVSAVRDESNPIARPSDIKTKEVAQAVIAEYAPDVSTVPK